MKLLLPTILAILVMVFVIFYTDLSKNQINKIAEHYPEILFYEINPKKGKLHFYHTDEMDTPFENHGNLKKWLKEKDQKLTFATNGGMYLKDLSPQGLYIEKGIIKSTVVYFLQCRKKKSTFIDWQHFLKNLIVKTLYI